MQIHPAADSRNNHVLQSGRSSIKSYEHESRSPFSSTRSSQLMVKAGLRVFFSLSCNEHAGSRLLCR
jgi:hypothetical protein